jgi:SAM-dependent methyltransferase
MIRKIINIIIKTQRKKRGDIFKKYFEIKEDTKILDFGGGDGSYIGSILNNKYFHNITVVDINKRKLGIARKKGFNTKLLKENGKIPFGDDYFDIAFCNSVIEHTTIPKREIWSYKKNEEFRKRSLKHQKEIADEIKRVSKGYFLQTPNKNFPIESHTYLPLIQFLPRKAIIILIKILNRVWVKKTSPDWNLLTFRDVGALFPDAFLYKEKIVGLTKSFIIIKNNKHKNIDVCENKKN